MGASRPFYIAVDGDTKSCNNAAVETTESPMHDVSIDFGDRIQCTAALCGTSDALFVLATAWMRGERWVVLQLQLEAAQPDDPREAQRVIVV